MAGANYMGGRINAAKARVRDSQGRLQKGHFGKQRLAVLSQGLQSSRTHGRTTGSSSKGSPISQISLAHAQRDSKAAGELPKYNANARSAYSNDLSTPPCKRRRVASGSSVSIQSRKPPRSRILQEIDRTEPLCMRTEIDRLLSLPDFAGLWKRTDGSRGSPSYLPFPQANMTSSPCMKKWNHSPGESSYCGSLGATKLASPFLPPKRIDLTKRDGLQNQLDDYFSSEDIHLRAIADYDIPYNSPFSYGSPEISDHRSPPPVAPSRSLDSDETAVSSEVLSGHFYHSGADDSGGSTAYSSHTRPASLIDRNTGLLTALRASSSLGSEDKYARSLLEFVGAHYHENTYSGYDAIPGTHSQRGSSDLRHRINSRSAPLDQPSGSVSDVFAESDPPLSVDRPPSVSDSIMSEYVVPQTLIDAVNGNLFEDSDPWKIIMSRLNLRTGSTDPPAQTLDSCSPDVPDLFLDLALARDRSGVGHFARPMHEDDESAGMQYLAEDSQITTETCLASMHAKEMLPPQNFAQSGLVSPSYDTRCSSPLLDASLSPSRHEDPSGHEPSVPHQDYQSTVVNTGGITVTSMINSQAKVGETLQVWKDKDDTSESLLSVEPSKREVIAGPMLFSDDDEDTEA